MSGIGYTGPLEIAPQAPLLEGSRMGAGCSLMVPHDAVSGKA